MFEPGRHTEIESYAGYVTEQVKALTNAAHGLTDEQARMASCRSALSIGGLLKHTAYVLEGRLRRRALGGRALTAEEFAAHARAFMDSFALAEGESLAWILERIESVTSAVLGEIRATDPDAETVEPPAPWFGRDDPSRVRERYQLMHLVAELAQHAGHADIIREQIDGAQALPLLLAVEGRPGNDFVQPWTPATP